MTINNTIISKDLIVNTVVEKIDKIKEHIQYVKDWNEMMKEVARKNTVIDSTGTDTTDWGITEV